ncbi:hypothetical protein SAMN06269185_0120 [Natronoarchaeum philippinense]|uniref:DUF7305 domain-containing protein n=1 Tax=Natronoarchaeum philippinense TaxID=558529 RepID=A0A285N0F3_NATPI|nr:hypothetical protein [Natronoarchaeum philippinense]SNZ02818.1 hypothetical protein SAMN06269185_0120 [Natronoarchaeum philippinense]
MNLMADRADDERGLSPVIGIVLLFGLVLFGATLVAVAGMSLVDTMQTESSLDRAETSMQQVGSDLSELANSPSDRETELTLGNFEEGQASIVDDGQMIFNINPGRTAAGSCEAEMDIGTLEYERGDSTVGFQAGGVWRSDGGSPLMVSQPDLTISKQTIEGRTVRSIDFPATNVDPDNSSLTGSTVEAQQNRSVSEARQTEMQRNLFNCLDDSDRVRNIEIRIEGNQYADAWYRYLDEQIGAAGTVRWDGDAVVATSPLGAPIQPADFTIENPDTFGALHTGSAFNPSNLNDVFFDGYDSQMAGYDDSGRYDSKTGKLASATDVTLNGNFDFYGDVFAGDSIRIPGRGNSIDGEEHPNADIDAPPTIDGEIRDAIDAIDTNAENSETSAVTADDLVLSDGGAVTLTSGVYHLDTLTVPEDATLTLDTSSGDVVIAAENGVQVEDDASVDVVGGDANQVRIFSGADVTVGGDVTVAGDRSYKNFWYAPSTASVSLSGDEFTGVAYAPDAEMTLDRDLDVYGSLIGGFDGQIRDVDFHYDNALERISGDGTSAVIEDGQVTGPSDPELESFDARATILGSEFSNDGRMQDIYPSLELESVTNDDDLDSLSYWQETSSRVSADDGSELRDPDGESLTERYRGNDLDRLAYGEYGISRLNRGDNFHRGVYWESVRFNGQSGDEIQLSGMASYGNVFLRLYDSNGNRVSESWDGLSLTLPSDDTYTVQVMSYNSVDYRLELRETSPDPGDGETFYHEDVMFDARNGDDVEIEVSSTEASPYVELIGPGGGRVAVEEGGSDVTLTADSLAEGQHTIRVSSTSNKTEFDYDISLKRTKIENAPLLSHGPIKVDLVTNPPNSSANYREPWPDPRLDARGYPGAGWNDDVNHPAVPEVRSTSLEGLEPGTGFSVEMEYRFRLCGDTTSYAGTSKMIDGTRHFEVGCSSNDRVESTIEYDPGSAQNQLKILRDGDKVPHVEPAGGQRGMKDMLGSRLNADDTLDLDDGEFVIAFELDETRANFDDAVAGRSSADYNDVVMLYEITDQHWTDGSGETVTEGPNGSPLDENEDYTYTVNIENNQIVIGSE